MRFGVSEGMVMAAGRRKISSVSPDDGAKRPAGEISNKPEHAPAFNYTYPDWHIAPSARLTFRNKQ